MTVKGLRARKKKTKIKSERRGKGGRNQKNIGRRERKAAERERKKGKKKEKELKRIEKRKECRRKREEEIRGGHKQEGTRRSVEHRTRALMALS